MLSARRLQVGTVRYQQPQKRQSIAMDSKVDGRAKVSRMVPTSCLTGDIGVDGRRAVSVQDQLQQRLRSRHCHNADCTNAGAAVAAREFDQHVRARATGQKGFRAPQHGFQSRD